MAEKKGAQKKVVKAPAAKGTAKTVPVKLVLKDIDLSGYGEQELREFHNRVKDRILAHMVIKVQSFSVGDKVQFNTKSGEKVVGVVKRRNTKTVSITTASGGRWNVGPGVLSIAS
jgi:long-subunit fatty acid transport protein